MAENATDTIKQGLSEIKQAVENAAGDRTIDYDKLAKVVAEFSKAQKGNEQDTPDRKGETAVFGERNNVVKGGKYDGMDVNNALWAHDILAAAKRADPRIKGPSQDLQNIRTKALTATGSATGDEYVPTSLAAALWDDFFMQSRVAGQFARIAMPSDPFDMPLGWGALTWRKGTQNTAVTVSDPATAKSTMTTTEQIAEVNLSYDLEEDALVAVMPTLRESIAREGAEQIDKFIMNADSTDAGTGNINLDDADPDADSYYLSNGQDGLRHLMIVDNTGQATDINTTLTDALLRAAIAKLDKYGMDTQRLVLFCNPKTYVVSMLGLSNVVTYDKFGPQATVLTGQLASYQGIAVVPTSAISLAEDDGKLSTTGSNNDEGTVLVAHRDMWRVGFKRDLTLEVDRLIQKRQMVLVASFRMAMAAYGTRSTAKHTAGAFGITYS